MKRSPHKKLHGMAGKTNASKVICMDSTLPRVRCSDGFRVKATARAVRKHQTWSVYIRGLIEKDLNTTG